MYEANGNKKNSFEHKMAYFQIMWTQKLTLDLLHSEAIYSIFIPHPMTALCSPKVLAEQTENQLKVIDYKM